MFTPTNPFTLFSSSTSSSSYDPSLYIISHETNDHNNIFLNSHNPPSSTIPMLQSNNPQAIEDIAPSSENAMISKQNVHVINEDQQKPDDPLPSVFLPVKKHVKKDRHSKIYTAQGLRDRRVRLSIEMARKFFDLQDMLGFDKASKTLEWLLSKSRRAIKELAQSSGDNKSSSPNSTTSESGKEEEGTVSKEEDRLRADNEKKTRKIKKLAASSSTVLNLVAKESRAKARERARERTRVKMCNRKLYESKKQTDMFSQSRSSLVLNHHNHHLHHCQEEELLPVNCNDNRASPFGNLMPKGNIIEESVVFKRKLKPSSSMKGQQMQSTMMGFQQNLVMFNDTSWNHIDNNNSNSNLVNLPQNWDINSAISHSNLCAITNVNHLPTGLHLYGKL